MYGFLLGRYWLSFINHRFIVILFFLNSSGVFIRTYEDKTGILDMVEQKIAKVTLFPRTHGEVFLSW